MNGTIEEAKKLVAGPLGQQMEMFPLRFCKPTYFGVPPSREHPVVVNNGTASLLDLRGDLLAVTCHHVIEGYRRKLDEDRRCLFAIGNCYFDLRAQLVAEDRAIDVAVLRLTAEHGNPDNGSVGYIGKGVVAADEPYVIAINGRRLRGNRRSGLGDFGADVWITEPSPIGLPVIDADAPQAFVKFLGEGNSRVPSMFETIEEIRRAGCHWAVAYPASKRPSGVEDDAVIFIGRLTREPNDIRIFGRAIGIKHEPGRDDATAEDITNRPWKANWPRYIRVHHAEFVAGTLANGISLNELMDALGADSFVPTQRNATRGEGNTDPRKAYRQQAAVKLSKQGLAWLSDRLQAAFDEHGNVPRDMLDKLDWPILP